MMWFRELMNILRESFAFAVFSLFAQKFRAFLSLIGVVLGVFSVIVVISLIDSMKQDLFREIETLGKDVLYVGKYPWTNEGGRDAWRKYQSRPSSRLEEMEKLKRQLNYAKGVSFWAATELDELKTEQEVLENVVLNGVSEAYPITNTISIERGRFFSPAESLQGSSVAIVSKEICDLFFPFQDPINQSISLLGKKYTIIAVLQKSGESMFNQNGGKQVYVPIKAFAKHFDIKADENQPIIVVSPKSGISLAQLEEEIVGIMRNIRRLNPIQDSNFAINSSNMIKEMLGSIFSVMNLVGIIIGIFALLVGMFGISNIMVVSVKERTAEIGIQKALGAKKSYILFQFLFESILLCILGGLLSLVLIYGLFELVNSNADFGLTLILSKANIVIGVVISILVGVLSGIFPANRAARMHPVEAISSK
ncbi:MAG: ABC transporter permease [Flavobacteriales bacterium]